MKVMDSADIPLRPRHTGSFVPLTSLQLCLWRSLSHLHKPLSVFRTCASSVRVLGPLSIHVLQASVRAVVERHESLRTRITLLEGVPGQRIDAVSDCHFEVVDLAAARSEVIEIEARQLSLHFMERKIDLMTGPLFEARLLRLSDQEHILVLAIDHIVSDAVSCGILTRDIWTLYDDQIVQGAPRSLPPLPVQFADYAVWLQQTRANWLVRHEAYWKGRLANAPHAKLPFDNSPTAESPTFAMMHFPFGKTLTTKLRKVSQREVISLPLVVLSIYALLMSRWCNQQDLVVKFTSHGRYRRPELENMIGLLATANFLRIELSYDDCFVDLLNRIDLEFRSASEHDTCGQLLDFVKECRTDVDFNWIANWAPRPARQTNGDHPIKLQPYPIEKVHTAAASPSFAPVFTDTAGGIIVTVRYRPDLFVPSTIERFGHGLRRLAQECTDRPHASISSIVATHGSL